MYRTAGIGQNIKNHFNIVSVYIAIIDIYIFKLNYIYFYR